MMSPIIIKQSNIFNLHNPVIGYLFLIKYVNNPIAPITNKIMDNMRNVIPTGNIIKEPMPKAPHITLAISKPVIVVHLIIYLLITFFHCKEECLLHL